MFSNWLSITADTIGIVVAAAALINTMKIRSFQEQEQARLDQKIKIRLVHKYEDGSQRYIDIPGQMRREEMTRSEVLGWIGMLPMSPENVGKRYKIESLSQDKFHNRMNEIQEANGEMIFEIDCTEDELRQFSFEKKKDDPL